ncbi:MAG: hypothetical protein CML29_01265 [Rhizobiales bacterium]|nr:hypothetical protein [Hyphomicrobiales bacterium]MBA68775.1 hypothetical protein [Hyphomicrobiales bacterium]
MDSIPAGWLLVPEGFAMNHSDRRAPVPLTRTEIKCLSYVAQGWNDEQIGKELILTRAEVESILNITISKLGAENRTAAVAKASRLGMLDEDYRHPPFRQGGYKSSS